MRTKISILISLGVMLVTLSAPLATTLSAAPSGKPVPPLPDEYLPDISPGWAQQPPPDEPPPAEAVQEMRPLDEVETLIMPALETKTLVAESEQRVADGLTPRFAHPFRVQVTPKTSGTWEKLGQNRLLWRLRIVSPGARSLNLGFARYVMPPGGRLTLYTPDHDVVVGPFTAQDNEVHGQLWTPILAGDDVVVELSLPAEQLPHMELELTSVNHDYVELDAPRKSLSGSCHVDVICPEGDEWRDEIRSVGAYTVEGRDVCSGALINNAARDMTPYFLTAKHCGVNSGNAASVVVYWNYENSICRPPGSPASGEPGDGQRDQFNTGAFFRASYKPSDFALIELDDPIDPDFDLHWAGWDRTGSAPTSAVGIHHPRVEEKRISIENDPTTITDGMTHILVGGWDLGSTELGSSGSPLFDSQHRIVGDLTGGLASCYNDGPALYGRVYVSWTGGGTRDSRLSDWLDPLDSGVMFLDGQDHVDSAFGLQVVPAALDVCAPAGAVYNITVTQNISSVEHLVTLSAINVPANTLSIFDPNPVPPTGSSALTISNTGAAAVGDYSIGVIGVSVTDTSTSTLELGIYDDAPGNVTLLQPANGKTAVSPATFFDWSSAIQGWEYDLEIATDVTFGNVVYSATVHATKHVPESELEYNTIYYWRVRANNACGDGRFSNISSFSTYNGLPGECDVGTRPHVLLSDDFESGAPGWMHGGSGDTWTLSTARPHGGDYAYHAQDVNTVSDQHLDSPTVTLPMSQPLTLQFWNYQEIESGCQDGAILEISRDEGNTWTQVEWELRTDPYDGPVDALGGVNGWCGDPQDWLNSVVDLNTYAGQTVQFRFRLGTNSAIGREGWYIDDVVVQWCQPVEGQAIALDKSVNTGGLGAVALGDVVTYTLVISNSSDDVANNVVLIDPLPPGVTFGDWVMHGGSALLPPPGTVNLPPITVEWSPGDVAAGAAYTLSFTANVVTDTRFAGDIIVNTAYVTADYVPLDSDYASFRIEGGGPYIYLPFVPRDAGPW